MPTYALRLATPADFDAVFARAKAFNVHEGIALADTALATGLRVLLAEPHRGDVWLVSRDTDLVGYAIVTYGYDLEYGGPDSYLTDFWIDEAARGAGAGTAALALISDAIRAKGIRALHLQVRADNPAQRLYEQAGFIRSPRVVMTKTL